jgi:hypothetical protein
VIDERGHRRDEAGDVLEIGEVRGAGQLDDACTRRELVARGLAARWIVTRGVAGASEVARILANAAVARRETLAVMPPRRHRWLTIPSGLLLFACLGLPGYRDCGTNHTMTSNPLLVAGCLVGLVAALCAIAVARRRGERWLAIAIVALGTLALGVMALGCAALDQVYAGITLGAASSVGVMAGGLIWEREARGRPEAAATYFRLLVPLVVVGTVATAALSRWTPLPDQPIDIPPLIRN